MTIAAILDLPMPPSLNAVARIGKSRATGKAFVFSDRSKAAFFREAEGYYLQQKRNVTRVDGHFTYHLTLNETQRHGNADGDNRQKYVLDFLQRVGVIANDKYADGGSWSWGPCEHGCRISISPSQPREANLG